MAFNLEAPSAVVIRLKEQHVQAAARASDDALPPARVVEVLQT